jgi:hypothetical protein
MYGEAVRCEKYPIHYTLIKGKISPKLIDYESRRAFDAYG